MAFVTRYYAAIWITLLAAAPSAAHIYWRKPMAASGFTGLPDEFRRLATEEGTTRVNHFCAVVRETRASDGDHRLLEVYWREGGQILRYGPSSDGRINPLSQDAGATVDLHSDVVPTEKDVAGSTTRVTRAWVASLIARCRQSGASFTVLRKGDPH